MCNSDVGHKNPNENVSDQFASQPARRYGPARYCLTGRLPLASSSAGRRPPTAEAAA